MGGIFSTSAYKITRFPWSGSHLPSVCKRAFPTNLYLFMLRKNYYILEKKLSLIISLIIILCSAIAL